MPAPDLAQRDRILREALTILGRDGERALTVRAVARAAGCSTTGVYTYFNGRPGLLDAILVDGFDRLDAAVSAAAAEVLPGPDAVRACCRAYMGFAASHAVQYELMFATPIPDFERSEHASTRGGESFIHFRDVVAQAIESGGLDDGGTGPALVAGTLWATMHGHAVLGNLWPLSESPDLPWEHDVEKAIAWLLRGASQSGSTP